jgi:hypothetical protein
MKREKRKMTDRTYESGNPSSLVTTTDTLITEDPPPKRWLLTGENYGAARRALFAARAQMV